jgi:hypothetical protein
MQIETKAWEQREIKDRPERGGPSARPSVPSAARRSILSISRLLKRIRFGFSVNNPAGYQVLQSTFVS